MLPAQICWYQTVQPGPELGGAARGRMKITRPLTFSCVCVVRSRDGASLLLRRGVFCPGKLQGDLSLAANMLSTTNLLPHSQDTRHLNTRYKMQRRVQCAGTPAPSTQSLYGATLLVWTRTQFTENWRAGEQFRHKLVTNVVIISQERPQRRYLHRYNIYIDTAV